MVPREKYLAGVPCWMDLTPADPQAAVDFYGSLFGWQFEHRGPAGDYHVAQIDGLDVAGIGTPGPGSPETTAWTMYVTVDDLDESVRRVREASGRVIEVFPEIPGVGRSAACADPAGATFSLWQPAGMIGARLVNAPGTWNFNDLTTTDPAGAEAFYGSVFGWRALPLDAGDQQMTMWVRPGYGEFLAIGDPGIKQRQAEVGAPDDFWDSVGWLAPAEGIPSSWSVTFAVDDPDGVTELAEKQGARILQPPVNIGVVRMAVIEDPQGAPFTVSRYQPEAA